MIVLFLLFLMIFFVVAQKYLLEGYLNTLALINLKRSDFINNHKDKISYLMLLGVCYSWILIVCHNDHCTEEKKRP